MTVLDAVITSSRGRHFSDNNLSVRFIGEEHEECASPYYLYVQFGVPGGQLEGIETIELQAPLDPAGSGELVDLVRMGGRYDVGDVTA